MGFFAIATSNCFLTLTILISIQILCIEGKIFTKCEFGKILLENKIELNELPKWICLAAAVSDFNSSKITDPTRSNKEYGIYQISNVFHCYDEEKPKYNECKLNCTKLIDDDLNDDIQCAKKVKGVTDFPVKWFAYRNICHNKSLEKWTVGCDFINGTPPIISNIKTKYSFNLNSTLERILCEAEGTLPLDYKWLKFNQEVLPTQYPVEYPQPTNHSAGLAIKFNFVTDDTKGIYSCAASNAYGQTRKEFNVRVINSNDDLDQTDSPNTSNAISPIVIVATSVILAALVTAVSFYIYHKCTQSKGGLSKQQINQFYEGLPEKKDTETYDSILDKIYSKPYQKYEFEIPKNDILIDFRVVLGSGQFGIVYKGTYKLDVPVAVKTVKSQDKAEDNAKQLQALLDEVKVMSFIGQHPNIVSMVGALTKNLKKDELYVVLEYCPVGSLKSFLKKQRSKEILEYPEISVCTIDDSPQNNTNTIYIQLPETEEIYIKDFISYALQIAYGMEFLTQKKIIHADLATRNVLLLDRYVAKVTDFGLSKRMSDYQEYIRNNQEFVPWRWWSIESLRDFTFTSKSDVWSYGVTLWEIFTLAQTPYPEHIWNSEFSQKLKDGLRLPKPELASDYIYDVMLQCWKEDPDDRPTFHAICELLRNVHRKMCKFEGEYGESNSCRFTTIGYENEYESNDEKL